MNNHHSSTVYSQGNGNSLREVFWCFIVVSILFLASCATVGRDFPSDRVSEIQIHQTTRDAIRSMFGPPWRVGIEDGQQTWTYGRYHYRLIGETSTKDLVVRFDKQGIVVSYSFNTTEHQE
jgi:hypothetical protein